jgi:cardiolipin synthase
VLRSRDFADSTEILVDSGEFCTRLAGDLAGAKHRAWVQTLSFEGDEAGLWLAREMLACKAGDRRVMVDTYTRWFLSDRFLYHPRNLIDAVLRAEHKSTRGMVRDLNGNGVGVRFVAPMGLLFRRLPARDHKKIVLIDDRIAYIGGINFSDHNFEWHDLMIRFEDAAIASFLRDDYLATWAGGGEAGRAQFEGIELFSLDGVTNEHMLEDVLTLIRRAEQSIVVHNAYVTFPFCEALRDAASRGARVTVLTPSINNREFMRDYMIWEAGRSGFEVSLYPDRMSHLKAMLVDDRYLIAGSSNFDWLTYGFQPELLAVISRPDVIAQFRARVLEPDLARSESRPTGDVARGRLADRVMRLIALAARAVCGREHRRVPGPARAPATRGLPSHPRSAPRASTASPDPSRQAKTG